MQSSGVFPINDEMFSTASDNWSKQLVFTVGPFVLVVDFDFMVQAFVVAILSWHPTLNTRFDRAVDCHLLAKTQIELVSLESHPNAQASGYRHRQTSG